MATAVVYGYDETEASQLPYIQHAMDNGWKHITKDEAEAIIASKVVPPTYAESRAAAYPSIGDQLDDLFRQGAFSPEMAATLHAVKTAHPKGR